jgi:hypothetical protein
VKEGDRGSPNERKSLAFSAEFHRKLLNERCHDWRFIRLFDSQVKELILYMVRLFRF